MIDTTDRRHRNENWRLRPSQPNGVTPGGTVTHALLMDIRDELQRLNGLLFCANFTGIPAILRGISRNTRQPKKRTAR